MVTEWFWLISPSWIWATFFNFGIQLSIWRKILTLCRFGRSCKNVSGSRKLSRNVIFEAGSWKFPEILQNSRKSTRKSDFDHSRSWEQRFIFLKNLEKLFDGCVYREFDFLDTTNRAFFDEKITKKILRTKNACSRWFLVNHHNLLASSVLVSCLSRIQEYVKSHVLSKVPKS